MLNSPTARWRFLLPLSARLETREGCWCQSDGSQSHSPVSTWMLSPRLRAPGAALGKRKSMLSPLGSQRAKPKPQPGLSRAGPPTGSRHPHCESHQEEAGNEAQPSQTSVFRHQRGLVAVRIQAREVARNHKGDSEHVSSPISLHPILVSPSPPICQVLLRTQSRP